MKNAGSDAIASIEQLVRTIEQHSSAEVVVEVRSDSGSYRHADGRVAAASGFAALLGVLFAPLTFSPAIVPLAVASSYLAALLISRRSHTVRRLVTTRRERASNTRAAAAAAFFERGVANTSQESGVLVLFSRMERRIEILADRGVLNAVPVQEWNQIKAAAGDRAGMDTLAGTLRALQPLLARSLPAREGDVNELPDAVQVGLE